MQVILAFFAVVSIAALVWVVRDELGRRRRAKHAREVIRLRGGEDGAPPTLHPDIDPDVCIGSGACVTACPEQHALVIVDGRGHLADAGGCVGHGACAEACPVNAITLVFGSARRGVELPEVGPTFETSQRGVYVAGELGGMGLVANAVRQGVKAVDSLADELSKEVAAAGAMEDVVPLLIVGAGPAGIAATLRATERNIRTRTIERETSVGGSVRTYPRGKIVMTHPVELPLYGRVRLRRTNKDALIELWEDVIEREKVSIEFGVVVEAIEREDDVLVVRTSAGPIRARRVLLAAGRRGRPRRLGVKGEELPHVRAMLEDPAQHDGEACLVVGGGDSAVEAALALAERPGTGVVLSYRGDKLTRVKPESRARLEALARDGRLRVELGSRVLEIGERDARVALAGGREERVPAQVVLALVGRELPTTLLAACGVDVRTYRGDVPAWLR